MYIRIHLYICGIICSTFVVVFKLLYVKSMHPNDSYSKCKNIIALRKRIAYIHNLLIIRDTK